MNTPLRHRGLTVCSLGSVFFLISHWIACGFAFIANPAISPLADIDVEFGRKYNGQTWLVSSGIDEAHPLVKYTRALHFATQTMALMGDGGMTLQLPGEVTYAIVSTWVGIVFVLYASSKVHIMLRDALAVQSDHMQYIDRVLHFAQSKRLPIELQRGIIQRSVWEFHNNFADEWELRGRKQGKCSFAMFRGIGLVIRMPFFQGMERQPRPHLSHACRRPSQVLDL